jgi:hypothetical protein
MPRLPQGHCKGHLLCGPYTEVRIDGCVAASVVGGRLTSEFTP